MAASSPAAAPSLAVASLAAAPSSLPALSAASARCFSSSYEGKESGFEGATCSPSQSPGRGEQSARGEDGRGAGGANQQQQGRRPHLILDRSAAKVPQQRGVVAPKARSARRGNGRGAATAAATAARAAAGARRQALVQAGRQCLSQERQGQPPGPPHCCQAHFLASWLHEWRRCARWSTLVAEYLASARLRVSARLVTLKKRARTAGVQSTSSRFPKPERRISLFRRTSTALAFVHLTTMMLGVP